jgi:hypothetical protein
MSAFEIDAELKTALRDEAWVVRQLRKGVLAELQRVRRTVVKRAYNGERAMTYTLEKLTEFFQAELNARRVSQ